MKKWIIISIIVIIVGSIAFDYLRPIPSAKPVTTPVTKLKTYQDSGKYYTIKVPSNWQAKETIATSTTGMKSGHPVNQQIEVTQYYLPEQMGITVQVYKGQPACPLPYRLTTFVDNLPAAYDPVHLMWTIPTTTATIAFSYAYPGNGYHNLQTVAPTAIPKAVMDADQKIIAESLTTFLPKDLKPFQCPK